MKRNLFRFLILLFVFIFISGCKDISFTEFFKEKKEEKIHSFKPVPLPEGTIIAKVGTRYITLEQLDKEIEAINKVVAEENPEARIDTLEEKSDYLTQLVNRHLLYSEALNRGLDKDGEYLKASENFKITFLVAKLVDEILGDLDVGSKEIEDYYNQIKDYLKEPQERKVREIVLKTELTAREVLIDLLRGQDFASVAMQRSIVKSSRRGGDLEYIKLGSKDESFTLFDEIVFSPTLGKGKLSTIFKGPEGYYIVKLEDIKEGHQPTLSEVWDRIKTTLRQQGQQDRINNLIDRLSKETKVEIYKENLE